MSNKLQDALIPFGIPPSRSNARIILPLVSTQEVQTNLRKLGLTAEQLSPIDWRNKHILSPPQDQASCGDCWAMSSTSALADRFMIQKGFSNLDLNPAVTAQCVPDTFNQGCGGGIPATAGKFFETNGIPETGGNCPTWSQICVKCSSLPQCNEVLQKCQGQTLYKAIPGSTKTLAVVDQEGNVDHEQTIINMKTELQKGPFVVCFLVPKDFMASAQYKWTKTNGIFINGAYNDILDSVINSGMKSAVENPSEKQWQDIIVEGNAPAGHAVEIIGWGNGDAGKDYGTIPYWIIKNSWGSSWMDKGYFRIAMNLPDKKYNSYLGMDIPVKTLTIASTGQNIDLGGLFGGGTSFDPDPNTGREGDGGGTLSGGGISKKTIIVLCISGGLVLLAGLFFFLKRKKGKGSSR